LIIVKVRGDEPFERALKRFKKKWEKAGVLRDVKNRRHFVKPSEENRLAREKALREQRRASRYNR
jgi:small subunit ribosomal protein S21